MQPFRTARKGFFLVYGPDTVHMISRPVKVPGADPPPSVRHSKLPLRKAPSVRSQLYFTEFVEFRSLLPPKLIHACQQGCAEFYSSVGKCLLAAVIRYESGLFLPRTYKNPQQENLHLKPATQVNSASSLSIGIYSEWRP